MEHCLASVALLRWKVQSIGFLTVSLIAASIDALAKNLKLGTLKRSDRRNLIRPFGIPMGELTHASV